MPARGVGLCMEQPSACHAWKTHVRRLIAAARPRAPPCPSAARQVAKISKFTARKNDELRRELASLEGRTRTAGDDEALREELLRVRSGPVARPGSAHPVALPPGLCGPLPVSLPLARRCIICLASLHPHTCPLGPFLCLECLDAAPRPAASPHLPCLPCAPPFLSLQKAKAIGDSFLQLEKYVNLNYMGFHKILKKHDKMLPATPCRQFYIAHLHNQPWVQVSLVLGWGLWELRGLDAALSLVAVLNRTLHSQPWAQADPPDCPAALSGATLGASHHSCAERAVPPSFTPPHPTPPRPPFLPPAGQLQRHDGRALRRVQRAARRHAGGCAGRLRAGLQALDA